MFKPRTFAIAALALTVTAVFIVIAAEPPAAGWKVHDRTRPQPPVITPPTASTQDQAGQPPSDAIVLFDGKDLSKWQTDKGEPAAWKVENGYMQAAKGSIRTKDQFGDCQLHVEFMAPDPAKGKDQDRGNSGVFLHGRYEFQVLDNYQAETYADGMVGSVYGQYPPQVNAARAPGQWQTYDIIFHGPRFAEDGKVTRPARATVLLNGVLVQDNVELKGGTSHINLPKYTKHPEKGPIALQDHAHPVRYRNIWIREITDKHPDAPTQVGDKKKE